MASRKPDTERIIVLQGTPPCVFTTIQLPNPSTGHVQTYLCNGDSVQEVQRYKQRCSSWFVGNNVVSDGSLHTATPIDPLFLLLPALEKGRRKTDSSDGMFCSLDDLLDDPDCPALQHLKQLAPQHLPCICDTKLAGGDTYYRLNDNRVMAWLTLKARQAVAAFQACSSSSIAALEPQQQVAYVLGFLSEYLSSQWHKRLVEHCGVEPIGLLGGASAASVLRPASQSNAEQQPAEKKPKVDPKEAARRKAEQSRAEAKAAQMAKQAAGSKKLTSFFTKK